MNNSPADEIRRPVVLTSIADADGFRCVDIFQRADGSFGYKEFRRDPEDAGGWTLVGDHSLQSFSTQDEALGAAAGVITWLASAIGNRPPR
jgi:hypothetical protein